MCFLNGDLGGNLTASVDFGVEEYYDKATNTTTYTKVPIETIIREGVHTYAKEPYHNIIINDLDAVSVELLEYKGDTPLYLFREVETDQFVNFTDNGKTQIKLKGEFEYINLEDLEKKGGRFDHRVKLDAGNAQDKDISKIVCQTNQNTVYTVAKLEYGQTAGYRYTDLTYAGDLISTIGESFTSILDKIKIMLGDFEYFYDLQGRFVFQKKRTYTQSTWNNIIKVGDEEYVDSAAYSSSSTYKFENANLITTFQNTPNFSNLKNDYSIWGERESVSGEKIPVHYRYAIDKKPNYYKTFDGDVFYTAEYSSKESEFKHDWRELIYQMALDYYKHHEEDDYEYRLKQNNPDTCFKGSTGYEQYYTDIEGFWRQLYNPNPDPSYVGYSDGIKEESFKVIDKDNNNVDLFINGRYEETKADVNDYENIWALVQYDGRYELQPWIDALILPDYYYGDKNNTNNNKLEYSQSRYYRIGPNGKYYQIKTNDIKSLMNKALLYYLEKGVIPAEEYDSTSFIRPKWIMDSSLVQSSNILGYYKFNKDGNYYKISELDEKLRKCYFNNGEYFKYLYQSKLDVDGSVLEAKKIQYNIRYFGTYFKYITNEEDNWRYWTKDIVENPSSLNFWFDFMDTMDQFSIPVVGDRTKVVNDSKITSIYFRQVPQLIFTTRKDFEKYTQQDSGYTVVFITGGLENMFKISSQGKSAQDKLDELIYNNSYCIESVTIQAVPIYYLQPNTRIFVRDDNTKINGEYIVSKISLPLAYNGTMSITATKAPEGIRIS